MTELWSFLTDPANRETLTWIGGGIVAACGGLWTAVIHFRKRPKVEEARPEASAGRVATASGGGVAIAGDVTNSPINAPPKPPA
jgi:hypothetical protein